MLGKLFGKTKKAKLAPSLSYEEGRDVLVEKGMEARQALASHGDARPEMLYYLADDKAPEVRRCVAKNARTPLPADKILADDSDDEVRCELARKIGALLPGLNEDEQIKIREQAIEVLEMLASDQLPRVRQIVAEEIKRADNIPKDIVMRLARDVENAVCAPILEYSPLLNKDDLREIIATTRVQGALAAIANRHNLDEDVSGDIAASLDIPAVAALLANESAQIREETLDAIIDSAADIQQWHAPIVMRPNLSIRAIRRISTFVASVLFDQMVERHEVPSGIVKELRDKVLERIKTEEFAADDSEEDLHQKACQIFERGEVDHAYIISLLENKQGNMVIELLALKAGLPRDIVVKIMDLARPEAVTALTWYAGLPMRTAIALQGELAHIPPSKRLNAKGGVDFPLSEKDMKWQIECIAGISR